jgi:hypothetical protein
MNGARLVSDIILLGVIALKHSPEASGDGVSGGLEEWQGHYLLNRVSHGQKHLYVSVVRHVADLGGSISYRDKEIHVDLPSQQIQVLLEINIDGTGAATEGEATE